LQRSIWRFFEAPACNNDNRGKQHQSLMGGSVVAQYYSRRSETGEDQDIFQYRADESGIGSGRSEHSIFDHVGRDKARQDHQRRKTSTENAQTSVCSNTTSAYQDRLNRQEDQP
jgi:hypothetical protein